MKTINKIKNTSICLFFIFISSSYAFGNNQPIHYDGYEDLGFYHFTPDGGDCDPRVYYRLIRDNSSGNIYYERYVCPPGTFFNCETNQCVMEGVEESYCRHIIEFLAE